MSRIPFKRSRSFANLASDCAVGPVFKMSASYLKWRCRIVENRKGWSCKHSAHCSVTELDATWADSLFTSHAVHVEQSFLSNLFPCHLLCANQTRQLGIDFFFLTNPISLVKRFTSCCLPFYHLSSVVSQKFLFSQVPLTPFLWTMRYNCRYRRLFIYEQLHRVTGLISAYRDCTSCRFPLLCVATVIGFTAGVEYIWS